MPSSSQVITGYILLCFLGIGRRGFKEDFLQSLKGGRVSLLECGKGKGLGGISALMRGRKRESGVVLLISLPLETRSSLTPFLRFRDFFFYFP
jgi:hypothetical protein